MHAAAGGGHFLDAFDDVHAFDDFTEYTVAPALQALAAMIEKIVVGDIDEELCGGRVRILGARHGQRAGHVLQAVVGFIVDGGPGRFLVEVGVEAAALDHEPIDHPVEQRAVIMTVDDVLLEIGGGVGGLVMIEAYDDIAEIGLQNDHVDFLMVLRTRLGVARLRHAIIAVLHRHAKPAQCPPARSRTDSACRLTPCVSPSRQPEVSSTTMTTDTTSAPNFIRNQIREEVESGKTKAIVTRFPPEPNGFLHIGHAKSICLNFGLAEQFGGACHLRFDDTNPAKEEQAYIDAIKADVSWLGFEWAGKVRFASDYFDQLYAWAQHLIREGKAYVDDLSPDEIREYRGTLTEPGRPSPYRERSPDENLDLLERMRGGEFAEGEKVLRAKIDMASPNINLRDPILYRIRHAHHHQTGDKWKIYPSYDFAHGQSDAIEGVTHSICTLEFEDHRPLYEWLLDNLPVPCTPRQIEFARLNLDYTLTSKRKLKLLVDEDIVDGWDDPRLPTISGMRRRGYTPASIRKFCEMIGVTRADGGLVDIAMLTHAIRSDLEDNAPRAMCVLKPLKVVLTNVAEGHEEVYDVPGHPARDDMAVRKVPFTRELWIDADDFMEEPPKKFFRLAPGQEVRLRNSYVIRCDEVIKNAAGEILELRCSVDFDTLGKNPEGRKVKGVIHWVSATHGVPMEVRLYDNLFQVEQPDKDKDADFLEHLNPDSLIVCQAFGEPSLSEVTPESRFQFERVGYFCADRHACTEGKLVFNRTVGLKDSWAKIQKKG